MPTIVVILTFKSMINTTSKCLKPRNAFILIFSIYEHFKLHAQFEHEKSFITRGAGQSEDLGMQTGYGV